MSKVTDLSEYRRRKLQGRAEAAPAAQPSAAGLLERLLLAAMNGIAFEIAREALQKLPSEPARRSKRKRRKPQGKPRGSV